MAQQPEAMHAYTFLPAAQPQPAMEEPEAMGEFDISGFDWDDFSVDEFDIEALGLEKGHFDWVNEPLPD